MSDTRANRRFRSQEWFDNPNNPGMTALYLERYQNSVFSREELQGDRPIIGIANSGSDLAPCNKIHVFLMDRIKAGIREAGGVPMEFPVHPIQETGKRPTAALDRNLTYLGLVEVLHGYPIDGVVLTTGCDKTTPAMLMGAATTDLPAIALNGGPMLDGWWKGKRAGSGTVIWESRRLLAEGKIDYDEFMERACHSAPSLGHCNTMGTASTMNALAEALGMTLTGAAAIPAPFRERMRAAYETGKRIVGMVLEDLRPSAIMTRQAFENAIVVNSAIGGSTNAPPHLVAIARHAGVPLETHEWETIGFDVPLMVNMQPAGAYLGESFFRAGGVPAVMGELRKAGRLHEGPMTATGRSVGENLTGWESRDMEVITTHDAPLRPNAGFKVISGNLFDSALMKSSVISQDFRERFLKDGVFEGRAVVFEGPEDYHERINEPALGIDEHSVLFVRGVGCVGYPGFRRGREHAAAGHAPEGGGDASSDGRRRTPVGHVGKPVDPQRLSRIRGWRRARLSPDRRYRATRSERLAHGRGGGRRGMGGAEGGLDAPEIVSETPWQEIYRSHVGQLGTGGCLELATAYQKTSRTLPRDNH